MLPFRILDTIVLSFGSGSLINLQSEMIDNQMSRAEEQLTFARVESKPMLVAERSPISNRVAERLPISDRMESKQIIEENLEENLSERQLLNIKYWEMLCENIDKRRSNIQLLEPNKHLLEPNKYHYQNLNIGVKGFLLRAKQTVRPKEISVSFIMRGRNSTGYFYSFRIQQTNIEKEFGDKLEWWAKGKPEKRVSFRNEKADPSNENDWSNQHKWLIDMLEKLYEVFNPRIEELMMDL